MPGHRRRTLGRWLAGCPRTGSALLQSTAYHGRVSSECLFCRIVSGELPADVVHREKGIIAFTDIHPVAETHVLVVPERHIDDLRHIQDSDAELWLRMACVANEVAADLGHEQGYRFYVSVGSAGGQTVPHLHIHVMGGSMRRLPV